MKRIVILGGSYAGVSTAHRILKQVPKATGVKVTLVSPNTHFYWSMASPRGVVPGQIPDEKLFQPIADGFVGYPPGQFEHIVASAESLDVHAKTVGLSGSTGLRTLDYDFLILATGSRTHGGIPFKVLGSTEATKDALHDFQARVKKAKTIVIAGAGVTGVEVAGELGFEYGKQKEIILIASGPSILEEAPASVSKIATKALQDLNVKLQLQTKVTSSSGPTAQSPTGRQELTLSRGQKIVADMYVPTFGLVPNSSYIPAQFLDAKGFVLVDEMLRVKGTEDVWAVGDVSAIEPAQFITCDKQSAHLAKNMTLILSNKTPLPYKVATSRFMGLQIGKKAATGHFGTYKVPGFIIAWARKTLFVENLAPTVNGSLF
ncbi:hypothetical protein A1O3_02197 [Capronia epimyces CBS 606.96]|uniref:FAD/NAD(P)-binding domain-containing protein n=1 Tax=Capronia epimyces CBS 606.96 TaxID=1182542 RepID=W9Y9B7_9EURO|nr:uncharacterized protein A1O3_02197 [Capronia epimyces CBS 606.96]EXJ89133.1 hypothetical protein A1O3_02197 [Capronia epimyces CBS 606.96]